MKDIPDQSIDLIVTDPPYGIDLTPQRENGKFKNTKVINDNNLDWLPQVVEEYYRLLKPNSAGYIFCNWQNYDIFKQAFAKRFTIKNCIVWNKDWFGIGNNWRPNHEFIMLITNGIFKTKSNNKSNIITQRRMTPQKMTHSCEKPIKLLEELITESSEEDDLILDSFVGTGSLPLACINTHRNYIGFELDPTYCNIANKRIQDVLRNT
jgi:site-specific DNA-methyltransferase (adenine-specific)